MSKDFLARLPGGSAAPPLDDARARPVFLVRVIIKDAAPQVVSVDRANNEEAEL